MMVFLIHLLAILLHLLPFNHTIIHIHSSHGIEDMLCRQPVVPVLKLVKVPRRRVHEHHVPALVCDGAMTPRAGELAWKLVNGSLVVGTVEGELVGRARKEHIVLGDDDGPWRRT